MTDFPAVQTRLTATFPQTVELSRDDLTALLGESSAHYQSQQSGKDLAEQRAEDDAFFEAFFHSLPQVTQLYEQHASLLQANEAKASSNNELQKPLEELRTETQGLFDRAKALEAEWPRLEAQMNEESKVRIKSKLLYTARSVSS